MQVLYRSKSSTIHCMIQIVSLLNCIESCILTTMKEFTNLHDSHTGQFGDFPAEISSFSPKRGSLCLNYVRFKPTWTKFLVRKR